MKFEDWKEIIAQQKLEEKKLLEKGILDFKKNSINKIKKTKTDIKPKKLKVKKEFAKDRYSKLEDERFVFTSDELIGDSLLAYGRNFKMGVKTLMEKLLPFNKNVSPNTIIDQNILNILNPKVKENLDSVSSYLFVNLKKDIFSGRTKKIILRGEFTYETYFSDLEAFSLCKGLKNTTAKKLGLKYFSPISKDDKDYYDAHMFAMSALGRYGGYMLSYCLSLPPLPFKNVNVIKAFSMLQKIDKRNPSISFLLADPYYPDDKNKYSISFGLREIGSKIDPEKIYLKSTKTNKVLAILNLNGTIKITGEQDFYRSQLNLFLTMLNNPRTAFITFGEATGVCAICGKYLTTHASSIKGIGPVCARILGI